MVLGFHHGFCRVGLAPLGCGWYGAWVSSWILHSRMPLVPTPARLKLLHACDQWHSSRVSTTSYRYHRKLCRNAEDAFRGRVPADTKVVVRPLARCAFFTMDSALLGLAALGCGCCTCTVRVFYQNLQLEDAIGSHACSEALAFV